MGILISGQSGGSGDMSASTYDPLGLNGSQFALVSADTVIDLNTGNTDYKLFTVPVGYKFVPKDIAWEITTYDTPGFNSSFSLGYTAPNYTDWVSSSFTNYGGAVGDVTYQSLTITGGFALAGTDIYITTEAADGANDLDARVYLYGLLMAV